MAKVLLIQPSTVRNRKKVDICPGMPLGLIYVGSSLEQHGHKIKVFDRDLHPSNEELIELLKEGWDFVGLSTLTSPALYDAIDVSKMVKENSKAIVVWGGFHVMSLPELTLKNPYVDYIIRGEVEETFPKVLELYEKGKDFSKLKGINLNPPASPPDLSKIPLPNYDLVELDRYADFPVSTARGCPYRCRFCYNSYGDKSMKPYRDLGVEKSIELIKSVVQKYNRKVFTIVDDNFPSDIERMKKICDEIAKLKVNFNVFCRANYATVEVLSYLKKSGCWQVNIGIESGSQRMLNYLHKASTVEMNREAIKNCRKVGIKSFCSLMVGLPTQTMEDIRLTENFIRETKPDSGGVSVFYLLPRTTLFDECKEKGLIKEPETLEEWADLFPIDFCEPKTNFSELSNEEVKAYKVKFETLLNKWKYIRKLKLYLKNGRLPGYRRILGVLKEGFNKK